MKIIYNKSTKVLTAWRTDDNRDIRGPRVGEEYIELLGAKPPMGIIDVAVIDLKTKKLKAV